VHARVPTIDRRHRQGGERRGGGVGGSTTGGRSCNIFIYMHVMVQYNELLLQVCCLSMHRVSKKVSKKERKKKKR